MIRERFIETGGRPTRYLESGSGWPLLLIHGFPLSADMWLPQLERVPDGWRFIAPDLRGFGPMVPGDPPHDDGSAPSMDGYARDIGDFLDALHIDDLIIGGLSMGGYVTFALFRQSPERFTGMVLADTRPQADTPEGRAGRAKMRDLLEARGSAAVADQMIPKLLSPASRAGNAVLVERTRRMIEANAASALDAALAAMMERPDSTPDLARISCPVLVLVGQHDEVTPLADAERMHQAIPRSLLTVIPGAGHLSNLDRPDEFSRALHDFLVAHM
jgi:3-oxoadipate enol-lactonase